uniref:Uncharacterized protein n=1 Tax=Amphimedon queenslandica TaxID=400682 RepID=A0A1X7UJJ4_AMPQE
MCYHIIGARISIGLDVFCSQKKYLFQLRRNTQSIPQKRSGKKAPRKEDYEVICGPDSEESFKDSGCKSVVDQEDCQAAKHFNNLKSAVKENEISATGKGISNHNK